MFRVIDIVIDQTKLADLLVECDKESQALLVRVYDFFCEKLELTPSEVAALNRLRNLTRIVSNDITSNRNQIFKAANELGLKLPSSSF